MPIPHAGQSLERTLLRDGVYRRLRDAIVDGTLEPGEQLRDIELARWLGVSRTPVREALLRLGQAGLVGSTPGRSTTVSLLDPVAVAEARDVLAAMHALAVRGSVRLLTADDLTRMRRANRAFRAAVRAGDGQAALAADDELHAIPLARGDNVAVARVIHQFEPVVRRAALHRFVSLDGAASARQHDRLIRLCAAGDADGAAALSFDIWHNLQPTDQEQT